LVPHLIDIKLKAQRIRARRVDEEPVDGKERASLAVVVPGDRVEASFSRIKATVIDIARDIDANDPLGGVDTAHQIGHVHCHGRQRRHFSFAFHPSQPRFRHRPRSVEADVDAVSRATITVRAAAREIRDSVPMVARAVLSPAAVGR
jgi:hypothetical protein